MRGPSPLPLAAQRAVDALRAAFRASIVVALSLCLFAFKGGFGGSGALIASIALAAVTFGSAAGGVLGVRPRLVGVVVPALAASATALATLVAASPSRARLAGAVAGARYDASLPAFGIAIVAAALIGAFLGHALRLRWDHERASD